MMLRVCFIREIAFGASVVLFVGCGPSEPVVLDTRALVEELAGDEFEGRLTGSAGIKKAADYITTHLNALGAEPLPGGSDFRQSFTYTAGVNDVGTSLQVQVAADDFSDFVEATGGTSGGGVFRRGPTSVYVCGK